MERYRDTLTGDLNEILERLGVVRCVNGPLPGKFTGIATSDEAVVGNLTFMVSNRFRITKATVILLEYDSKLIKQTMDFLQAENRLESTAVFAVRSVKYVMAMVLDMLTRIPQRQSHIDPRAIIGQCKIGPDTRIGAYTIIHDGVQIGKNCYIGEHCNIGGPGFSFVSDEEKRLHHFPHIGGVIIEDDVSIFPFTNIDRGGLTDTVIHKGAKIDHFCHIAHNTIVGENAQVTAGSVLCGGSSVGKNCWIGIGSIIKQRLIVGDEAILGMGAVVTKDVPPKETWVGVPAKKLEPKQPSFVYTLGGPVIRCPNCGATELTELSEIGTDMRNFICSVCAHDFQLRALVMSKETEEKDDD